MKILAAVALILLPAAANSQSGSPTAATCQQRIDEVAARIPDLSDNPNAHEQLGISEAHLKAALAALDAARLARTAGTDRGCLTMADAAAAMLTEGGYEPTAETPTAD